MQEEIIHKKLKSGLSVYFIIDKRFTTSSIRMTYKIGWRHDDEKYLGLAHLFEHLVGKRTKKYPAKSEFERMKEELGIVSNAWTGPDETSYYQNQTHDKLLTSLQIFFEAIYNSVFVEEDLETEKGVVLTEARRYVDNDASFIWMETMKKLYPKTTLSKFFFGTDETMKNISLSVFSNFYKIYKNPKNGILFIATNSKKDISKIEKFLNDFYKSHQNILEKTVIKKVEDKKTEPETFEHIISRPQKEQANIRLAFRTKSFSKKERMAFVILRRVLVGGLVSRLYQKLRDELGLIYSISLGRESFLGDICDITFATQTKKDKVDDLISALQTELINTYQTLTQKDIEKVIPILEYFESLEINADQIIDSLSNSLIYKTDYISSKEFILLIKQVKVLDVKKLLKREIIDNKFLKVVMN